MENMGLSLVPWVSFPDERIRGELLAGRLFALSAGDRTWTCIIEQWNNLINSKLVISLKAFYSNHLLTLYTKSLKNQHYIYRYILVIEFFLGGGP